MALSEIIIEKIRENGPISFRDFMEISLYYPDKGYYTSASDKIGKTGDYFTSPYYTNMFGEMLGKQLEEMWHILDQKEFTIVEYGAGTGILCRDILNRLKNSNEDLYNKLNYCIVEKSSAMREKEKAILHNNEKVSWYNSIHEIPEINGCVLSNEVVDNFSVHQVVMQKELMEVFVDYQGNEKGFVEILQPASETLKDYMRQLNVTLPEGFRTEINLQATEWIGEIASALKKGFVLTIDYGYPSSELYLEHRGLGTLLCYNRHKVNDQPYCNIGEQDITAHVNFSALNHWGIQNGLDYCGYTNQGYFLRALGLTDHLKKMEEDKTDTHNQITEEEKMYLLQTLMMDMGSKFKVLIQQKGIPDEQRSKLSGMKFSQQWV